MENVINTKPSLWQVCLSVLGALFGVQSNEVRERDFQHGHAWWVYVAVGVFLVLILVLILVGLAKYLAGEAY